MRKFWTIFAAIIALGAFSAGAFSTGAWAGDGDAKKGKKVFNKCKSCHAVGPGAKKKVGPPLNNIIGAKFAHYEGFKFSKVVKAMSEAGAVWDEEMLDAMITKPKKFYKDKAKELKLDCSKLKKCKSKMVFSGLKKEKDRKNLIAYLKTFSKPKEKKE